MILSVLLDRLMHDWIDRYMLMNDKWMIWKDGWTMNQWLYRYISVLTILLFVKNFLSSELQTLHYAKEHFRRNFKTASYRFVAKHFQIFETFSRSSFRSHPPIRTQRGKGYLIYLMIGYGEGEVPQNKCLIMASNVRLFITLPIAFLRFLSIIVNIMLF